MKKVLNKTKLKMKKSQITKNSLNREIQNIRSELLGLQNLVKLNEGIMVALGMKVESEKQRLLKALQGED